MASAIMQQESTQRMSAPHEDAAFVELKALLKQIWDCSIFY